MPCTPTKPPPFAIQRWKARRWLSVSTSPLMLFQITASNWRRTAGVKAAPFSVVTMAQPLRLAMASKAA